MKITAGSYKYRKLDIPKDIRPTTEKVREAVFSMIRDYIPNAVCLDLFAGSGALGLEALSRGAAKCYFNEKERDNFRILKSNIENCKAGDISILTNRDYKLALGGIKDKLDVIFLDPPYRDGYYETAIQMILDNELLEDGGIIVAEHLYDNKLSERYGNLCRIKEKKYGTIGVDVYEFLI